MFFLLLASKANMIPTDVWVSASFQGEQEIRSVNFPVAQVLISLKEQGYLVSLVDTKLGMYIFA